MATTSPAAIAALPPSAPIEHQAAGVVEAFEAAGKLAVGKPHADVLAEPGRAREPVGADGGRSRSPPFHCASRPGILIESAANSSAAATLAPPRARLVAG